MRETVVFRAPMEIETSSSSPFSFFLSFSHQLLYFDCVFSYSLWFKSQPNCWATEFQWRGEISHWAVLLLPYHFMNKDGDARKHCREQKHNQPHCPPSWVIWMNRGMETESFGTELYNTTAGERKKKVFFSAVASRRRSQRPIPIEIFHTFVTLHRYTVEFNFWRWRLRLTCESPSSRKEPPTRRLAKQTRIPTGGSAAGLRPDGDVCSTRPSWRTTSGHSGRRHWSHSSSVHHSRPDMTCSRANKQTNKKEGN